MDNDVDFCELCGYVVYQDELQIIDGYRTCKECVKYTNEAMETKEKKSFIMYRFLRKE